MEPQPPPNPDDDAARVAARAARTRAREEARQEYIKICNANSQRLSARIMHLQSEVNRLQANPNPTAGELKQMKDLINQIAQFNLIMNLFRFCSMYISG